MGGGFDDGMVSFGGGRGFGRGGFRPGMPNNNATKTFEGTTDGGGVHHLHLDFDGVKPARPYSLVASAAVQDVNRQTWAANTSLLVHPSALYVGLRGKKLFVEKGKPLALEAIVSDIDGKLVSGTPIQFSSHAQRVEVGARALAAGRAGACRVDGEQRQRQGLDRVQAEGGRNLDRSWQPCATARSGPTKPS